MQEVKFEAQGVYAGIPYRVLSNGTIDAMMGGGVVNFSTMEQLIAAASGSHVPLQNEPYDPHLDAHREDLGPLSRKRMSNSQIVGWFIVAPIAGLIGLIVVSAILNPDTRDTNTRLMDQCKEQFKPNQEAVDSCFIRLGLKFLSDLEKEKLERAYRGIK
jgi:hypothetical protein